MPCLSVWPPAAALRLLSSSALSSAQAIAVYQKPIKGWGIFRLSRWGIFGLSLASAPKPEDYSSLTTLVRSLATQMEKVQSAVADITAVYTSSDFTSNEASSIVTTLAKPEQRIEATFEAIQKRLGLTWKFSLGMTFTLFAIFVSMVVLAIVFGIVCQQSFWGIFFGGSSVLSLLTVMVWKPLDKMLFTTVAIQQLELIQLNYQRALSGTRQERNEAFREVSAQLDSLLAKVPKTAK